MNLLKNYIAQHSTIVIEMVYGSPFTAASHEGIDGVLKPFLRQEGAR